MNVRKFLLPIIIALFAVAFFSIFVALLLTPAVSINLTGRPWIWNFTSIASRVVPGMFETRALSSDNIELNKLDLPALGFPVITIVAPSVISFPVLYVSRMSLFVLIDLIVKLLIWSNVVLVIASSEKSSSDSIRLIVLRISTLS